MWSKDYDAHNMWPKLGFDKWGEKRGRSKEGHPLVVWWRPIAALSLFDVPPDVEDERLVVALDSEIFAEIGGDELLRDTGALIADWVEEFAELVATDDVASTWDGEEPPEDIPAQLLGFRVLESGTQEQTRRVHTLLGDSLDSESMGSLLTSVSEASVGGATHFLTRDARMLDRAETIEDLIGIIVLTPEDFLRRLHTQGDEREFRTRTIAASGLLLWWVSGGRPAGGMRALSWLDAADSGDPRQLHRKYRHRGVLSEQDVVGRARVSKQSGAQEVTALLFSRTEVFPQPVPIERARELDPRIQRPGFLQTMQEMDEAAVLAFYGEATKRDE